MAAVGDAYLYVRVVTGEGPLVAGAQAELNRRRIGARGTGRAEGIGDRRAIGAEGVASLLDWLAEIRALGIVVEQNWRIRLPALVPGCRTLQCQPSHDPASQRRLETLDEEVLAVGVEENVADHTRIEEGDLDVVPVFPVQGPVPLQAMVEEFSLPADFIVRQLVRRVRLGDYVLRYQVWGEGMVRTTVLVEATRAKALRERVVHHDIRCDVPGQV